MDRPDPLTCAHALLAALDHVHALADLAQRVAASVIASDTPEQVRAFDTRFKAMLASLLAAVGVDPASPTPPPPALADLLRRIMGAAGDLIVDIAGFIPVGVLVARADGGVHGEHVLPGVTYGKEVARVMRIQPNDPMYSLPLKIRAVRAARGLGWALNNGNVMGAVTVGPQVQDMPCAYAAVRLAVDTPAGGV